MNTRLLNAQPYRFNAGDHAYVRGWPQDQSVVVTLRATGLPLPHYFVVDDQGHEWLIAQVELSSKLILQSTEP